MAYIAVLVIPATTIVEHYVADPEFNTIYIRSFAGLVGSIILFRKRLPKLLRDNFDLVWIAIATVVLPFCFGLILTLNAALTEPGSSFSPIWIYQYLVALFIFVQLLHSAYLAAVLWIVATLVLTTALVVVADPNLIALKEAWVLPLPVYLTALIVGSLANRNVQMVESEKLKAASAIGSNIAHELRTPLASIRILSRAIQKYLPVLVDTYQKALERSQATAGIGWNQVAELRMVCKTIEGEVDYSNTIINILLENTSNAPIESRNATEFAASQAIAEAAKRYPFNNSSEQQLLEVYIHNDFLVRAPYVLIVHVLFNLIKNGVLYGRSAPSGMIRIFTGRSRGRNSIIVTDNGAGISESLKLKVFDRFFTTTEAGQGAGIGLSFCKMVMEGIGGEIQCDSREGEYTTFRLLFPEIN
ncbi:MAG: HAMP domain-containing histidine kinase [Pseudomonadales bacterium]|nr:HAMP domain-containing histidine kinase [Pseudomonadales bacterium]